jgi:hypothetical protein
VELTKIRKVRVPGATVLLVHVAGGGPVLGVIGDVKAHYVVHDITSGSSQPFTLGVRRCIEAPEVVISPPSPA